MRRPVQDTIQIWILILKGQVQFKGNAWATANFTSIVASHNSLRSAISLSTSSESQRRRSASSWSDSRVCDTWSLVRIEAEILTERTRIDPLIVCTEITTSSRVTINVGLRYRVVAHLKAYNTAIDDCVWTTSRLPQLTCMSDRIQRMGHRPSNFMNRWR